MMGDKRRNQPCNTGGLRLGGSSRAHLASRHDFAKDVPEKEKLGETPQ